MSKETLKRYTRKSNEAANIQYKVISNRDGGGCGIFADNYFRQVDLAINKLGRIEDIEEEWGMPIEVIYKALKNGVRYREGEDPMCVAFERIAMAKGPDKWALTREEDYYNLAFFGEDFEKVWILGEESNDK